MNKWLRNGATAIVTFTFVVMVYGATDLPYETVSTSEASLLMGGTEETCTDYYTNTCGDGEDPPDEDCSANTSLCTEEEGEVAAENQQENSSTVCGVKACGEVFTTKKCD